MVLCALTARRIVFFCRTEFALRLKQNKNDTKRVSAHRLVLLLLLLRRGRRQAAYFAGGCVVLGSSVEFVCDNACVLLPF